MKIGFSIATLAAFFVVGCGAPTESSTHDAINVVRACTGDIETLCSGNIVGGEELKACAENDLTQLSNSCFTALMMVMTVGITFPPGNAKTAKSMRFDYLRVTLYCELNFFQADIVNETFFTGIWNSTDLNNKAEPLEFLLR